MTVVDRRPLRPGTALSSVVPKKPDNILMAVEVDRAAVIGGIVEAVSSYSRAEMPS
jgi:hypothetical protein